MILRTEAVVLRSLNYGETSQIVTLYTRSHGKMAVLAKGARKPNSRFGSSLQPMSYSQVVFYYKATRDLQTLSESSHVVPFHGLSRDLAKLTVGLRIVELTQALMHDEEANPTAFNLLIQTLATLNEAEARMQNLYPYYQMRMSHLLGFAPAFERADVKALDEKGGILTLGRGTIHNRGAGMSGMPASRGALRAFAILCRADLETVMRMHLSPQMYNEVNVLTETYLRHHIEGLPPSRSSQVLAQMASRK